MGVFGSVLDGMLELVAPAGCVACGGPLAGAGALEAFCESCTPLVERPASAQRAPNPGASVFVYAGPIADALVLLKYRGRSDVVRALGAELAAAARVYAGEVDMVMPVPLHPLRLRERGFNQAALLAAPVARMLAVPLRTGSLRRVRATMPQAGLVREARADNVRGAFRVRGRIDGRVLLIDDVRTTGATLTAAAEALRGGGARQVCTLALARAPG